MEKQRYSAAERAFGRYFEVQALVDRLATYEDAGRQFVLFAAGYSVEDQYWGAQPPFTGRNAILNGYASARQLTAVAPVTRDVLASEIACLPDPREEGPEVCQRFFDLMQWLTSIDRPFFLLKETYLVVKRERPHLLLALFSWLPFVPPPTMTLCLYFLMINPGERRLRYALRAASLSEDKSPVVEDKAPWAVARRRVHGAHGAQGDRRPMVPEPPSSSSSSSDDDPVVAPMVDGGRVDIHVMRRRRPSFSLSHAKANARRGGHVAQEEESGDGGGPSGDDEKEDLGQGAREQSPRPPALLPVGKGHL